MEALSYCQLMERCLAAEARVVELESGKVGNAFLEHENRHVEVVGKLTERITELTTENVALKAFVGECVIAQGEGNWTSDVGKTVYVPATEWMPPTPATDHIVAAQRSAFVDEAVAKITESGALTFGDCIVALCQLRESAK